MKLRAIPTLILAFLLLLTGCTGEAPKAPDLIFSHNGVSIPMGAEAQPILDALGEPDSYSEQASCAFEGLDKTYCYGSFYLTTCTIEGTDYVYTLWFADGTAATPEGIRIGSDRGAALDAYGIEAASGPNAYTVRTETAKLTIVLSEDAVSSIQYQALID